LVDFPLPGLQFVQNVAAAVAVASLSQIRAQDMKRKLERFKPLPMRMEIISLRGVTFINDAYNANPPSVKMALETLSRASGRAQTFVVLGDMLELGDTAQVAHKAVGRLIGKLNVTGGFLLGDHATDVAAGAIEAGMDPHRLRVVKSHQEIVHLLKDIVLPGDWVLVKGSRQMRMETVIRGFEGEA